MKSKEITVVCLFDESADEPRQLIEQVFLRFLEREIEAALHGG